ncbi:acetyl-coenzyme-A carboxylase [Physocladia obscura]|uniref:Acetyl-coenzyme-A carboxylase n=1 Tax=Physocladia obscura TaxID=109957 RepID=A0AAD5XGS0_9FUNG|nr:acetyl-coenzyme-A carboxylase [Physocladia obscura]
MATTSDKKTQQQKIAESNDNSGGNASTAKQSPPSVVRDFVLQSNGTTVITKILVANNGMAAVKCIRSIRRWSYETFGNDHAITFAVMATPEDLQVNAEYIRLADQYVEVPGGASNNNYSNVDLIVDIAQRTGVHAVYVGWGFASENPVLADKLTALNIVFMGPPASAMRSLGDKIASTIVAQSAEVPCVNWSGTGITDVIVDSEGHVSVPADAFRKATTLDVDEGIAHAIRIGYPVMVKASEGGGGKGIRLVEHEKDFRSSFEQVSREIPGSPIFIMKVVRNARHLEVQLLADKYGNAIALFGRDCSVQRRHQKILEEAPVTVADQVHISEMEKAAVRLAKLVGYASAGTVEYLYEPATKDFYFLELNPRLQVEHPTTEMVSGVNIPAAQLQVAMGLPLNRIKDVRILYGMAPKGTSEIDFDFVKPESVNIQRKPSPKGHVIAARITAENPEAGFKPNSGKVLELNFRSNSNVWGYFSVNSSGGVHEYADSQFGHVFSYGETRNDARRNLIIALKELSIRGDFRTTVEFLVKLLEAEMYQNNTITTGWLDGLIAKKIETEKPDMMLAAICGGVAKAHLFIGSKMAEYKKAFERGQMPSKTLLSTFCIVDFIFSDVRFKINVTLTGPKTYELTVNGSKVTVDSKPLADGGLLLLIDSNTHLVYAKEEQQAMFLTLDGKSCLLEKESDPTQLRSPSPGKLVRYLIEDGSHINAGDAFAEIEVMKMYMPLLASESGIIAFSKPAGSSLVVGDIVGRLALDDPSRVKSAALFDGEFPVLGPPQFHGDKAHQKFRVILQDIENILNGYEPVLDISTVTRRLVESLRNNELPIEEALEILSSLSGRIPAPLYATISDEIEVARTQSLPFPSETILKAIEDAKTTLQPSDLAQLEDRIQPFQKLALEYIDGHRQHERKTIASLFEKYLIVEETFCKNDAHEEDVLVYLREIYKSDIDTAVGFVLSHAKSAKRSELILSFLDYVRADTEGDLGKNVFMPICSRLAELHGPTTSKVSLKARELLMYYQLPTAEERYNQMLEILSSVVNEKKGVTSFDYVPLTQLITANYAILDILPSFFYHEKSGIRAAAFYTYVLHTYQAYSVTSVRHFTALNPQVFQWQFVLRQTASANSDLSAVSPLSKRVGSFSDLFSNSEFKGNRTGQICAFDSVTELQANLRKIVESLNDGSAAKTSNRRGMSSGIVNVLNIALQTTSAEAANFTTDEKANAYFKDLLKSLKTILRSQRVRRVTFMLVRKNAFPRYFTFKEQTEYSEDEIIRHIEPAMAYQLELQRLQLFDVKPCFIDNRRLQIYHAVGKSNPADARFFVRAIVYPGHKVSGEQTTHEYLLSEGLRILTDIMDALDIVSAKYPNTDCNHIFINFIPTFQLDISAIRQSIKEMIDRNRRRLWKGRVNSAEVRFIRQTGTGSAKPIRYCISSDSGFVVRIEEYQEIRDATGVQRLMSLTSPPGRLHHSPVSSLHPLKQDIQPKRHKAHLLSTTYVYDFPELFMRAIEKQWLSFQDGDYAGGSPGNILSVVELVLNSATGHLEESDRAPGANTVGMVAWRMDMFTPEYPEGRSIVVVANDITFQIGSFGTAEDDLFYKASEYARERGIPRIYISANSGARIGLADEVTSKFNVAWIDSNNPVKGFKYLYLDAEGHDLLVQSAKSPSVSVELIEDDGESRWKIIDVIGRTHGLGVENLQGSGKIAGETSRAYNEIFTATLVTCRSVGIGAYLVRLGQRAIQVQYTPIILTGAGALNKVLGREVYTSNLQLGGTQIMWKNGVSHLVAQDDMEGVQQIMNWLSYVPKCRDAPLPVLPASDSVDRLIDAEIPVSGAYDPRNLLAGYTNEQLEFVSGFFDRDSFTETLAGWAQGVVVGRARLGGIPMGVIAVETRATKVVVAADPASETSTEETLTEAGQVWYPNSAFKTAQAINDFNKGEQLPLIIFANWRGFSGGQSDMYKEVLKYGAQIVDALRDYKQPIFIYIIGELRGGAWVVLDPTINPEMMEMYAEENSRGGVLEPEGIVEIKFRKPQLLAAMERLDPTYKLLKNQLRDPLLEADVKAKLQSQFNQRERQLLPIFHQISVQFADLHDKPGRMLAKGAVSAVVGFAESRKFFYWRLLRRISEDSIIKEIRIADPLIASRQKALSLLAQWYSDDQHVDAKGRILDIGDDSDDDEGDKEGDLEIVRWMNVRRTAINERIAKLKSKSVKLKLEELVKSDPQAALEGFLSASQSLDSSMRKKLLDALSL